MDDSTLGSLWKLSRRSSACLAILFAWSLYVDLLDLVPETAAQHWPVTLARLSWVFIDALMALFVVGRLLQNQRATRATWRPVLRSAGRLYLRALLIIVLFIILRYLVCRLFGIDLAADRDWISRAKIALVSLPFSFFKILWFTALVARGRGLVKSAIRAGRLLSGSRLIWAAFLVWAVLITEDIPFSSSQLQASTPLFQTGWLILNALVYAFAARFVYTVALDKYQSGFGVESPDFAVEQPPTPEFAPQPVVVKRVSLWYVFLSFIPVLSVVAFLKGRTALRGTRWRSIRGFLAWAFGLFFTLVHILVIVGVSLPNRSYPQSVSYAFLAEEDPSLKSAVQLLSADDFWEAHERLNRPAEASEESWARLTALAIAQSHVLDAHGAFPNFEKAAALRPDRGEFYYFYGVFLLDWGQDEKAEDMLRQASRLGVKEELTAPLLTLFSATHKPQRWVSVVSSILILIILFAVHEFAHAYMAFRLGDNTAAEQGRLTLNPIAHLDLVGSVILPGILLWRNSDLIFGWAKPVPVNPEKFENPKHDHMLVSFAGPAANLLVGLAGALVILLILVDVRILCPDARSLNLAMPEASVALTGSGLPAWIPGVIVFLKQLTLMSIILACFNLLPIPPLDGSWILSGLAPERFQRKIEAIRPYGFIIFLALVVSSALDYILLVPILLFWMGAFACLDTMGFS